MDEEQKIAKHAKEYRETASAKRRAALGREMINRAAGFPRSGERGYGKEGSSEKRNVHCAQKGCARGTSGELHRVF